LSSEEYAGTQVAQEPNTGYDDDDGYVRQLPRGGGGGKGDGWRMNFRAGDDVEPLVRPPMNGRLMSNNPVARSSNADAGTGSGAKRSGPAYNMSLNLGEFSTGPAGSFLT
jgi:hypothetical protein